MLTEKEADGSLKVVQTGKDNITILRILTKQEKEDILKVIDEKEHGKPIPLEPVSDNEISDIPTVDTPAEKEKAAESVQKPIAKPQTPAPSANTVNTAKPSPSPAQATIPVQAAPKVEKPAPKSKNTNNDSGDGMEYVDISEFM